ncbi:MAG: glycosyltransferase family 2 protein, partial [Planctomycetota bacterium]
MRTTAVVVNWNGGERDNLECLASLHAQGIGSERIVFVDNASTDGSLEAVERAYPGLCVLRNDRNEGFGAGANQGAELALENGAGAVLFVNNDLILEEGALEKMERALVDHPGASIVGPRILYKEDRARIWSAGGRLSWRQNLTTLIGQGRSDDASFHALREVDYVVGAAMLVERSVFAEVGFFDAAYFAYMEDVDFCLAAKASGHRTLLCGEAAAYHGGSMATGGGYSARRKYMNGVNSVHFLRRYGSAWRWLPFLVFDVLPLPLLFVAGLFRGRGRAVLAKALGLWHGLLGRRVTAEIVQPGGTVL